jgi:hypothetical protein
MLSLGTAGGSDSSQHFTRIVGATRFSDGRVAIASSGNSEIRFFDSTGAYLMSAGRRGRGPGEFSELGYMRRFRGDSLVTYDQSRNVVMVFDGQGKFVSTARVTASQEISAELRGAFTDGTLLAIWQIEGRSTEKAESPRMSRGRVAALSRNGTNAAEFGRMAILRQGLIFGRDSRYGETPVIDTLFGAVAPIVLAAYSNGFVYADALRFEIFIHNAEGKVARVIRVAAPPDTIPSSEKRDAETVRMSEFGPDGRRDMRIKPGAVVWPETYPAFQSIIVDEVGNLWVRRYPRPGAGVSASWVVIDSAGTLVGQVKVPVVSSLLEIGERHMIGRVLDTLGVESIKVYRIIKRP